MTFRKTSGFSPSKGNDAKTAEAIAPVLNFEKGSGVTVFNTTALIKCCLFKNIAVEDTLSTWLPQMILYDFSEVPFMRISDDEVGPGQTF
jgi:hypothetical protein